VGADGTAGLWLGTALGEAVGRTVPAAVEGDAELVGAPVDGATLGVAVGRALGDVVVGATVGAEHVPSPVHKPLVQSRGPSAHFLPGRHLGHAPPPQSTAVSRPFLRSSTHVGSGEGLVVGAAVGAAVGRTLGAAVVGAAVGTVGDVVGWSVAHTPSAEQTPPTQSRASSHLLPVLHGGHVGPPQSTLVSSPFLASSRHSSAPASTARRSTASTNIRLAMMCGGTGFFACEQRFPIMTWMCD